MERLSPNQFVFPSIRRYFLIWFLRFHSVYDDRGPDLWVDSVCVSSLNGQLAQIAVDGGFAMSQWNFLIQFSYWKRTWIFLCSCQKLWHTLWAWKRNKGTALVRDWIWKLIWGARCLINQAVFRWGLESDQGHTSTLLVYVNQSHH